MMACKKRYDIQIFKIIKGFDNIAPSKFFSFNYNDTRGHIFRLEKQLNGIVYVIRS